MILTRERVAAICTDHDASHGFAGQFCRVCEVIKPCQTWILAHDLLECLDSRPVPPPEDPSASAVSSSAAAV